MESINRPIYRFFSFRSSERMASEYGHCSGQVNLQTGEILANISYGLFHYRETYQLNLADSISQFPHTTKELIICAARHAANEEGVRGMTRRRVIFVCKDGRRYITEEYNGDRSEYTARDRCLDGCDMDWSEIRDIFQEPTTYTQFIKANLRAQAAYHSFLSENGNSGIVRNLRKGREGPYADKFCLFTQHHLQLEDGFLKQTTPVSPPYRVSPIQPALARVRNHAWSVRSVNPFKPPSWLSCRRSTTGLGPSTPMAMMPI